MKKLKYMAFQQKEKENKNIIVAEQEFNGFASRKTNHSCLAVTILSGCNFDEAFHFLISSPLNIAIFFLVRKPPQFFNHDQIQKILHSKNAELVFRWRRW